MIDDIGSTFKDAIGFLRGIDRSVVGSVQSVGVAANLVNETVAAVKAHQPITESHSQDIVTPAVTDGPLLEAFNKLPDADKLLLINTALVAHKKDIINLELRQKLEKDMLLFKLKTWTARVIILTVLGVGVLTILFFIVMAMKDGATKDAEAVQSVFSVFFKTMEEVLKVIFLTEK